MAITAPTVTGDFSGFLPPEIAAPIFERAANQSVVQRLVRQVPLGGNGVTIPYVNSRPTAGWVTEGGQKPASAGGFTAKNIVPKKLAAILVVSEEVVRANPVNYLSTMQESLAGSFAESFDRAALHDEGPDGAAAGGPFSTYVDQTSKESEIGAAAASAGGVYTDLVNAMADIVGDKDDSGRRYRLSGWAIDAVLEPALRGSVDSTGRPLFVDVPSGADGTTRELLGRPSFIGEGVATNDLRTVVGYAGDWSQAAWGVVGGINFAVSREATVTINGSLVSLWENNLVAIRAEAEYGFVVADTAAFSKLINAGNAPVTSS